MFELLSTLRSSHCCPLCSDREASDRVEVILVDKDYKEINTLQEYFPKATIRLCIFHVVKIFREKIQKLGFTGKVRSDLESVTSNLVDAENQEVYDIQYDSLKRDHLCMCCVDEDVIPDLPRDKKKCSARGHEFLAYFREHWHGIQLMWCKKDRATLLDLESDTSNYIECGFGTGLESCTRVHDVIHQSRVHAYSIVVSSVPDVYVTDMYLMCTA